MMTKRHSRLIATNSVVLYAEAFGNLSDPPVLLISGAMAPNVFWPTEFCEVLSELGYLVIRFDNRDVGRSTHFPASSPDSGRGVPYSLSDLGRDAVAVLREFSGRPGHIVGHSMGGSIAQVIGVNHSVEVCSLTLVSSPLLAQGQIEYRSVPREISSAMWNVFNANPMHASFEAGLDPFLTVWKFLNGEYELNLEQATEYTRSLYETEVIEPAWNHMNVQENIPDLFDELTNLDRPILMLQGDKDYLPTHPENIMLLAPYLRSGEARLLSGVGHMFFNPAIWAELLKLLSNHFEQSTKRK